MIATWPGPEGDEYVLAFDRSRAARLLILPPLFDEANKTRHLLAEVMRRLDGAGIDSFLPDLPGCNESLAPLATQTLAGWRAAAVAVGEHFGATHVLTVRAGALMAPELPGWRYAAQAGSSVLRAMLRARVIASREAGTDETSDELLEKGREHGLELAGYHIGAALIGELESAEPSTNLTDIAQGDVGGSGLWLRAEPGFDAKQADALAAIAAMGLRI
ncbi:MAG TPA: hypothetical protein VL100_07555 [Croceibacterium sp.]|nr:hypothetical protein [Croceibacterium sp.]